MLRHQDATPADTLRSLILESWSAELSGDARLDSLASALKYMPDPEQAAEVEPHPRGARAAQTISLTSGAGSITILDA